MNYWTVYWFQSIACFAFATTAMFLLVFWHAKEEDIVSMLMRSFG